MLKSTSDKGELHQGRMTGGFCGVMLWDVDACKWVAAVQFDKCGVEYTEWEELKFTPDQLANLQGRIVQLDIVDSYWYNGPSLLSSISWIAVNEVRIEPDSDSRRRPRLATLPQLSIESTPHP